MSKNELSEISMFYQIGDGKEINIFGSEFVKNNKNKCKMIIDNNEYEIRKKYYVKNYNKNILEIKLKGIDNINKMSGIFSGCSSLLSLSDISKWNTSNVIYMSNMFCGCSLLKSLPDISKWNTNNVMYMCNMFYGCSSLLSLPDISKWNLNDLKIIMLLVYMVCLMGVHH